MLPVPPKKEALHNVLDQPVNATGVAPEQHNHFLEQTKALFLSLLKGKILYFQVRGKGISRSLTGGKVTVYQVNYQVEGVENPIVRHREIQEKEMQAQLHWQRVCCVVSSPNWVCVSHLARRHWSSVPPPHAGHACSNEVKN